LPIFRGFRRLIDTIETLTASLVELANIQRASGPTLERLDALELSRHRFEAEMEGMLLKADGKLKAASNAEARERQLKKSYEKHLLDPLDSDSQEESKPAFVLSDDAAGSEAQRVPSLHLDVASDKKAYAVRAKWGR